MSTFLILCLKKSSLLKEEQEELEDYERRTEDAKNRHGAIHRAKLHYLLKVSGTEDEEIPPSLLKLNPVKDDTALYDEKYKFQDISDKANVCCFLDYLLTDCRHVTLTIYN